MVLVGLLAKIDERSAMMQLAIREKAQTLQSVASQGWLNSWWGGPIRESYPGAWQQNVTVDSQTSLLSFSAVFACVTGIASDIAKMRIKLDRDEDGIWTEITENQPWLPLLRKPNHYQTRIKFIEQWIVSKLLHGNAYILKERDARGVVNRLYVLDPRRVTTLVADDGSVFYRLTRDDLSQIPEEDPAVPASEIIHDMMVSLWHPLVGVSPIYACGASATMGNKIQSNSTSMFGNFSRPGGVVMFPMAITDETAAKFKRRWEEQFGGANIGRTAVLDNGSKFEPITIPAEAAQLIEQLKWTVEDVARAFHYPLYKLGGPLPPYSAGPEVLSQMYLNDCLHPLIENLEECLDQGLELPAGLHVELDLDDLLRMDTASLYDSNSKAVGGGWMSPDEARFRANYKSVRGGGTPYLQQQNYSLEALAKRDAQPDPFKSAAPAPQTPQPEAKPPEPPPKGLTTEDLEFFEKELCLR
jgi:HK97 family phage portal protein